MNNTWIITNANSNKLLTKVGAEYTLCEIAEQQTKMVKAGKEHWRDIKVYHPGDCSQWTSRLTYTE